MLLGRVAQPLLAVWFCGPIPIHGHHYHRETHTAKSRCATYSGELHSHSWLCGFVDLSPSTIAITIAKPTQRRVAVLLGRVAQPLLAVWFCGPIPIHGHNYDRETHTAKSRCATYGRWTTANLRASRTSALSLGCIRCMSWCARTGQRRESSDRTTRPAKMVFRYGRVLRWRRELTLL